MFSHMVQDVCLFVFSACFPFFHDFPIWSNGFPMFFPNVFTMKPFGMKVTVQLQRGSVGEMLGCDPGSHHNMMSCTKSPKTMVLMVVINQINPSYD